MAYEHRTIVLGHAIRCAVAALDKGSTTESVKESLLTSLAEVGLTDAILDAALQQQYYLLISTGDDERYLSVLPRSEAVDAYLFDHSRRKANAALVREVVEMINSTPTGRDFLSHQALNDTELETLIRTTLNMNETGLRYGRTTEDVNSSPLLTHKIAALSNFALPAEDHNGSIQIWNDNQDTVLSVVASFEFNSYEVPESVLL